MFEMETIQITDESSNTSFEFIIQTDNTISYIDIERVFGKICGIKCGNICLNINNNKIFPFGEWDKTKIYSVIRPIISSNPTQGSSRKGLSYF